MTLKAWRIAKRKHQRSAFTGLGASRYPGRWNLRKTPAVYTSQSLSLAAMEMLTHLESEERLAELYVHFEINFDEALVSLLPGALPRNWDAYPPPFSTRQLGTRWADSGKSPILKVPSAVVEGEFNFILNPRHSDFKKIRRAPARPFRFDPRLAGYGNK